MTNEQHYHQDRFAKRVLGRIEDEHLRPRPRWEFLLKNYFFWTLGALAVLLGALAFAAMLFELTVTNWAVSAANHASLFEFFFAVMPFLWIGALALFILVGYFNIRWTNHGYRYSLTIIALGAILTSLTLGAALFVFDVGRAIEEAVDLHTPFHRPLLRSSHNLPIGNPIDLGPVMHRRP